MTLLHTLSYGGAAAAFTFVTLSLASGLLWLSELIEEHSRLAKAVGQKGIYAIIALHFILYFSDSLPLKHILFSVCCHAVYLQNFTASWPFISLTSLSFIASCILVIADHFLWFFYFARITQDARHRTHRPYGTPAKVQNAPGFADIATFFGVCVWLVPLFLFLSLSANDNALPINTGHSSIPNTPTLPSTPINTRPRSSLFRSLYDSLPQVRARPRRRDTSEGIIAPRSPNIARSTLTPSPIHSPTLLPRVPSMNGLPSPLLSPRRVSSDGFTAEPSLLTPDLTQEEEASDHLTPFRVGTPPRRMSAGGPPSRRSSMETRLEMRRTTSSGTNPLTM
ncbi:DUF396-domain-containing protein [Wolfiporia cocos MD-104 SS10]|uniref:DUF396-domain-containing protein n=1 Tax=Wolfiporia cocos (strain MD-104) TaxID=742152 RepID=A0A2H3JZ88_WOLCO|nr:DUF396-domain-containing protein [Wolfiporia cocos MD-104 SS10]